jgi:FkbM family methyltransferase
LAARAGYVDDLAPGWTRPFLRVLLRAARLTEIPEPGPFPIPGRPPLLLTPADSFVTRCVYWLGVDGYEPDEPAWWSSLTAVHASILELGANVGLYAVVGAAAAPHARYQAVEPNPLTCGVLRRNLAVNRLDHVEVVEAAVTGARAGGVGLLRVPDRDVYAASAGAFLDGAVDLHTPASRGISVPTMCAADLVGGVDLIKLDIEGLELEVLAGIRRWLIDAQPTIVVEVREEARRLQEFVSDLVADVGYSCHAVRSGSVVPVAPATLAGRLERALGTRDVTLLPPRRRDAVRAAASASGLSWRPGSPHVRPRR